MMYCTVPIRVLATRVLALLKVSRQGTGPAASTAPKTVRQPNDGLDIADLLAANLSRERGWVFERKGVRVLLYQLLGRSSRGEMLLRPTSRRAGGCRFALLVGRLSCLVVMLFLIPPVLSASSPIACPGLFSSFVFIAQLSRTGLSFLQCSGHGLHTV